MKHITIFNSSRTTIVNLLHNIAEAANHWSRRIIAICARRDITPVNTVCSVRRAGVLAVVVAAATVTAGLFGLDAAADLSWYNDETAQNIFTNTSNQLVCQYKVVNDSPNDDIYRLAEITLGAGTNEYQRVAGVGGGRWTDYDWDATLDSNTSHLDSNTGTPINPDGDYGWITLIADDADQLTMGKIALDAKSVLDEDFQTLYVDGPVVPEPETFGIIAAAAALLYAKRKFIK